MNRDQIALQLYTVRASMAADLSATLRSVAEAGYGAVELATMPPTAPGELARLLADTGLRPIASHEGIDRLRDDASAVADRLADLGCPLVIVPSLPGAERGTADDVRRFADDVNRAAATVARGGLRLGYHNHDFEFADLEGTTIWDILLDHLAPDVVLELDVFWASVAGRDPAELIATNADRIRALHMKDLLTDPETRDAPAGDGIIDLPGIVAAGRAAGVEWYIAEQDHPREPLADIGRAYRYLASLSV